MAKLMLNLTLEICVPWYMLIIPVTVNSDLWHLTKPKAFLFSHILITNQAQKGKNTSIVIYWCILHQYILAFWVIPQKARKYYYNTAHSTATQSNVLCCRSSVQGNIYITLEFRNIYISLNTGSATQNVKVLLSRRLCRPIKSTWLLPCNKSPKLRPDVI